jgi:hypothetical protein
MDIQTDGCMKGQIDKRKDRQTTDERTVR